MRYHVLALVLLVGCVGSTPPVVTGKPENVKQVTQNLKESVLLAAHLAELLCDIHRPDSPLCVSLSSSLEIVSLALAEVEKLETVYADTGLGIELLYAAIDNVISALENMDRNADYVRSLATYAYRDGTVPVAGGSTGGPVGQPPVAAAPGAAAPAAGGTNPYRQPAPAKEAR